MTTREQVKIFLKSAEHIYRLGDYTSATILYFKTLFAVHDVILLAKIGIAPKDHTERFRLLQKHFPEEYKVIDSEFNTYRSTYSRIISKETCDRIKSIVENEARKIQ